MKFSINEIKSWYSKKYSNNLIDFIIGDNFQLSKKIIKSLASLDEANSETLTFAQAKADIKALDKCKAAAIIADSKWQELISKKKIPAIISDNPYLLFTKIAYLFYRQPASVNPKDQFDCRDLAKIDSPINYQVKIGAFSVVEKNIKIGNGTQIGSQCWIGENVKIGKNCCIYPQTSIYPNSEIGDNVIIHSGATIGADGYGFIKDQPENGKTWFKIPQLAKVIIGNNVEIGANCAIDRGALSNTIIGDGVKIDNYAQVGHGAKIGSDTLLMGFSAISGSVVIGKNCLIGGQAGIGPGIIIADNVIIHPQAFVVHSVLKSGEYSGTWPLQNHQDWLKTQIKLKKLIKR